MAFKHFYAYKTLISPPMILMEMAKPGFGGKKRDSLADVGPSELLFGNLDQVLELFLLYVDA